MLEKWFMVVIFSGITNGHQDSYVFVDPNYNTVNECISAANDPKEIPKFAKQLVEAYGEMKDIQKVICATGYEIKATLKQTNLLEKDT